MRARIIDTETTDAEDPRPIEIGESEPFEDPGRRIFEDQSLTCKVSRWNPMKPINYGAMAVHHITDAMVADCPPWTDYKLTDCEYIIGHNIDFDWNAIGKPDVKRICTLALAQHLWPTADSHALGAMLYMLDAEYAKEWVPKAHSAGHDVVLCGRLLTFIMGTVGAVRIQTMEDLWQWSERARIPEFMSFGKYGPNEDWAKNNGGPMRCSEVRRRDNGYWNWLMNKCDQVRDNPYLKKALTG